MILSPRAMRGVSIPHNKRTRMTQTVVMEPPESVILPMRQHIGAPCTPTVSVGDKVFVGQKIGESPAFVSSPIHSSVSGTVRSITDILMPDGSKTQAVEILSDGLQTVLPTIAPPVITSRDDFVKAVRESGIVGLGGAGFPTAVKLAYKNIESIKTLYVNFAECEPYITTDNREVVENVDGVIEGIQTILKYTGIPKAVIVLENNKPVGTKILTLRCSEIDNISVKVIGSKYPKGAEKVLVYEAGGPVIGRGKLPADCGVLVMNVTSVAAIESYVKTGIPLVSRRVTIDGDLANPPMNIRVPIGTRISDVLTRFRIDTDRLHMLLIGGAMMGMCCIDTSVPVTKTTNALLCFEHYYARNNTPCIHCGRCIRACPIRLSPALIEKAYDRRDAPELTSLNVDLCINCGCCSYVCPAKRDLSHKNQLAKAYLKSIAPKKPDAPAK